MKGFARANASRQHTLSVFNVIATFCVGKHRIIIHRSANRELRGVLNINKICTI